jgi:hypothetical protein
VIPVMWTSDLASARVLLTLVMMCALSFWWLVGGGELKMKVRWLV